MKHIKQRIITTIALIVLYGLGFAKVIPFTLAAILALVVIVLNILTDYFLSEKENKESMK